MEEKVFFELNQVRVTNTRFQVDGQTYAVSNITSVKPIHEPPGRIWPVLLALFGLLPTYAGIFTGIPFAFIAAAWWYFQSHTYFVLLHTSGGETRALKSHKKDFVDQVVAAINDAIVHRG